MITLSEDILKVALSSAYKSGAIRVLQNQLANIVPTAKEDLLHEETEIQDILSKIK